MLEMTPPSLISPSTFPEYWPLVNACNVDQLVSEMARTLTDFHFKRVQYLNVVFTLGKMNVILLFNSGLMACYSNQLSEGAYSHLEVNVVT